MDEDGSQIRALNDTDPCFGDANAGVPLDCCLRDGSKLGLREFQTHCHSRRRGRMEKV